MGKLQEKMKADLTLKGYSEHTQEAYLRYLGRFAKHYMRSPGEMGEEEVRAFLLQQCHHPCAFLRSATRR